MRTNKVLQQSHNGFAWDHPLRARWREMGNDDPALSRHPAWHAFTGLSWILLSMVLAGAGLLLVFFHHDMALAFALAAFFVLVASPLPCIIHLSLQKRYRGASRRFDTAIQELSGG